MSLVFWDTMLFVYLLEEHPQFHPRVSGIRDRMISSPRIDLISFKKETAYLFGRICSERSIAAPDAIQLACAAQARVDLFLTNDRWLARRTVPGIQFIADLSFDYL